MASVGAMKYYLLREGVEGSGRVTVFVVGLVSRASQ